MQSVTTNNGIFIIWNDGRGDGDDIYGQLIDINGRQVFNRNYIFENKINLNFENISSGIYILKLNNKNVFYNYKLILN